MNVSGIYTDSSEYSRYHQNLSAITATIEVNGPTPGDIITVSIFRLDGYGIVCSKKVTLTAATNYNVTFDLNVDGYVQSSDEGAISNPSIYMAKQGDYVIQTTDADGNIVQSDVFAISIVPVWELRNEWIKGVTLYDYEILEPRVQPQNITGVCVTEVSADHDKGPFALSFVAGTPSTLTWDGGPSVNIIGDSVQTLLLMSQTDDFIMVKANPLLLPTTSQTDTLYIDNGRIKDRALIDQLRRATSWVEQKIVTKVEPTVVDTDSQLSTYSDETAIAETYYRPRTYNKWMSFQIPYPNILDMNVTAYFNQAKTAVVPRQWLVWDERSGICELVPSASSEVIWTFYNGVFIMQYLFNTPSIPSFWHYRATVGLRDLNGNRAIVRQAIAMAAATQVLVSAGSSYRAGFASQSTSRDGVTQSEGFTSSAMYGTYGGHYINYQKWLDEEIPRMRTRFAGLNFRTI
jgi:hypothetical protein